MSQPADLKAIYEDAVYEADLPTGCARFQVGQPPQGPAPVHSIAIITAWNPGRKRPSARANRDANRRLVAALEAAKLAYYPARGFSRTGHHEEPSFAVPALTAARALALGRAFSQSAVFYWDGATATLLWVPRGGI